MPKLIGEAGRPYGHVAGHSYLDVEVYRRRGGYELRIVRGSAQGRDEEHGRVEVERPTLDELREAALEIAEGDEARRYVETAIARAASKVRGRGRPRAEKEARAADLPRVRVTEALDAAVRARATTDGIEVSELVRRALVRYLEA